MEQEGVIKFNLRYQAGAALANEALRALDAWRNLLFKLGLIGQDPARYGGVGYGNVSQRLDATRFAVTGSQTAHLPHLRPEHYAVVTACDVAANTVVAEGPIAPSSESLTHHMVYRARPDARFVFHAHSPPIWRNAAALSLPVTPADAPYGTPAMAQAVAQLLGDGTLGAAGVFAMGGHEDGVVSFAATAEEAGVLLVSTLARALQAMPERTDPSARY